MNNSIKIQSIKKNPVSQISTLLLFSSPIFCILIYAILNRNINDFLTYPIYIGLILIGIILIFLIFESIRDKEFNPSQGIKFSKKDLPISIFGFVFVSVLYYSTAVVLFDLSVFLKALVWSNSKLFLIATITLISGAFLFYFRLRFRGIYGFSEILMGITMSIYQSTKYNTSSLNINSELFLILITAGTYLVVRGLDNMHQGFYKDPKDPILVMIMKFVSENKQSETASK